MADLTAKGRKALPKKDFGLSKSEKYPVEDKSHAADAKARATQQYEKGNLSGSQRAQIDKKANKVLKSK